MPTTTVVNIIPTSSETALYRHYDGQTNAQSAYIELALREETLSADYNSEVGNAVPFSVYHGFERRYPIPTLTGSAADRLMEEIAPLADRILADWTQEWDGNNMVAVLGDDAKAAEAEIEEKLSGDPESSDAVQEWDVDGATNGNEAEEYGITAQTTNARLDEIEAEIIRDMSEFDGGAVVIVNGLADYLRQLRDDADED